MRRKRDFKRVVSTPSHECFPESYFDIVTTVFFQTSPEKSSGMKIY